MEHFFGFYSKDVAEKVTSKGKEALNEMKEHFSKLGYRIIEDSIDGLQFELPNEFRYTDDNPYVSDDKPYVGYQADVVEFNDLMKKK